MLIVFDITARKKGWKPESLGKPVAAADTPTETKGGKSAVASMSVSGEKQKNDTQPKDTAGDEEQPKDTAGSEEQPTKDTAGGEEQPKDTAGGEE